MSRTRPRLRLTSLTGLAWPVAAGALLAVGALVAVGALRGGEPASVEEQARVLAAELRCPDCQGLSVADSPTASAVEIRRQISAQLAAGRSADEVRAHFVERYGDWILLSPPTPLFWVLPFVAVAVGGALLVAWLAPRRRPASGHDPEAEPSERRPSEGELRRVRDEAEALDG